MGFFRDRWEEVLIAVVVLAVGVTFVAVVAYMVDSNEETACREMCQAMGEAVSARNSYGCLCSSGRFFQKPENHTTVIHQPSP